MCYGHHVCIHTFNLSSVHIRVSSAPFGWKARCTRATPRQPTASTRICCAACGGWTAGKNLTKHAIKVFWRNHLTSTSSVYVCFCSVYKTLKTAILSSHSRLAPSNKGSLRASHASSFRSRIHNVSQHNSDRPDLTDTIRLSRGTLACIHAKDCSWCGRSGRSKPVGISACRDWVSSLVNEKAKQKSLKSLKSEIIELPGLLEKVVLVILVLELLCFKPFLNAFWINRVSI